MSAFQHMCARIHTNKRNESYVQIGKVQLVARAKLVRAWKERQDAFSNAHNTKHGVNRARVAEVRQPDQRVPWWHHFTRQWGEARSDEIHLDMHVVHFVYTQMRVSASWNGESAWATNDSQRFKQTALALVGAVVL